jgi:hypothetical protein
VHLGQLLAGDAELAGRAAPAEREHHRGRALLPAAGPHRPRVAVRDHAVDAQPGLERQLGAGADVAPQRLELLLAERLLAHGAVAGQLEAAGHHDLRARVVTDGAAEVALLDQQHAAARRHQAEGRRDPGGTGADDDGVEVVADAAAGRARDRGRRLAALLDRVADQAHAAQLADHVDAGVRGLEVGVDRGQLDAAVGGAEHQRDGLDRARRHAAAVADAGERVDQVGAAVHQADHVVLGAGPHARARADAGVDVDRRVDRRRHQIVAEVGDVGGDAGGAVVPQAIDQLPGQVHGEREPAQHRDDDGGAHGGLLSCPRRRWGGSGSTRADRSGCSGARCGGRRRRRSSRCSATARRRGPGCGRSRTRRRGGCPT